MSKIGLASSGSSRIGRPLEQIWNNQHRAKFNPYYADWDMRDPASGALYSRGGKRQVDGRVFSREKQEVPDKPNRKVYVPS